MFLLLKLSVATCSSLSENLLSCPRCTSGSSSAAQWYNSKQINQIILVNWKFLKEKNQPGTSKKTSWGFLRRHHANAIAGAAKSKAAPAATPPAIAPVALFPPGNYHHGYYFSYESISIPSKNNIEEPRYSRDCKKAAQSAK